MRIWIKKPLAVLADGAENGFVIEGAKIVELVAATMGGGESPPSPRPLPAQMHRVSRGG